MLKTRKSLSIVLTLCLCMALLAPVFVFTPAADATATYTVLQANTVSPTANTDIGIVKVTIPDTTVINNSILTVSMPSDFTFPENVAVGGVEVAATYGNDATGALLNGGNAGIEIVAPGVGDGLFVADFADQLVAAPPVAGDGYFRITPNNTFDIKMAGAVTAGVDKYFYIYFYGVNMNNFNGDVKVNLVAPSGSGFSTGLDITVGKSNTSGSTTTSVKKVKEISSTGGFLDIITAMENSANTINPGESVTLKILTKGYTFGTFTGAEAAAIGMGAAGDYGLVSYGWNWAGTFPMAVGAGNDQVTVVSNREIKYKLSAVLAANAPGKVSFSYLKLVVDDTVAKASDEVEIEISGADVDESDVVVAKYVDYGASIVEGTTKDLVAGQTAQKIGEFYIQESAFGTLANGRTITMELPAKCEWSANGAIENMTSGTVNAAVAPTSKTEIIKWTITGPSTTEGAKVKFKSMKINVSPAFSGPIEIKIAGSAGVTGTVKVGEVKPAATLSVDKASDVILGKANQKINDIKIVEGAKEGFLVGNIYLNLDSGYRFTKVPTVTVSDGNIDLNEKGIALQDSSNRLCIPVRTQSSKASTITISDVYVDAQRTAPEGPIMLTFTSNTDAAMAGTTIAVNDSANNGGRFDNDSAGEVQIANCVTPAETEGTQGAAVGQFKIGSNIYTVNSVAKVMDAAPYIKGDRTYVPIRFLAYACGLTDADIAWDAATQTATLTKGDNKVELTIGSTTITVNGEAKIMDVAPEISNDRTMLPARYVAEGLGYVVGWDPGTGTVLLSK